MLFGARARRPAALERVSRRQHRPDYWLVILSLVLLGIGLVVIYSISPALTAQRDVGANYYVVKQLTAIGLGIVAFLIAANIRLSAWRRLQTPVIIAAVVAAGATMVFGEEVNDAVRWIHIGGLSFQSVELIKFAVLLWLASFLADRIRQQNLGSFSQTFKPIIVCLGAVGVVVAVMQSDLGSAAVIAAMIAAMCFVAGLPLKRVLLFGGIVLIGVVLAIAGSDHRRERVATFLNPESDCLGAGYHVCQALIALGSGGLFGRGVGQSVQAYGYTPEAANDSIFAIYGEMFGFVGSLVLIGLLLALFARIRRVLERSPDAYTRLLMAGALAWLSTQALINIGAMIGALPVKGITLPFISHGGTSIVFVTAVIGLVFNASRYTAYATSGRALNRSKTGRLSAGVRQQLSPGYVTRRRTT